MKVLDICRPRAGVDPRTDIAPRAAEEMDALRDVRGRRTAAGGLLARRTPGGPGAILIFDGEREEVDRALGRLPLLRDGLIEAELTELHPFAALAG